MSIYPVQKTFSLFAPYIKNNAHSKKRLVVSVLLILLDVGVSSFIPYLSKKIVDSQGNPISSAIFIFVLLLGFFWVLEKTLTHIQDILFFPVVNTAIQELTRDVVQHLHRIPLSDYQQLSIPEIINCIRRISMSARAFIKIFFLMLIPTLIKLLITTVVIIKLGLFGLGLFPAILLSGVVLYKGTQWYITAREHAWKISDEVVMRVNDSILNTKITRFFQPFEMAQISGILGREAEQWLKTNTRLHMIHILIGLVLGTATIGILVGAIFAIQHQTLTMGDFVLIKAQLLAAFMPFKTLSVEFRQLIESTIDIKKIVQILDIPIEHSPSLPCSIAHLDKVGSNTEGIVLNNVSFSYTNNNNLFSNLSLNILKGTKLGIIGNSGSGKSSLLSLIASLHQPQSGHIFIQGQKNQDIPKVELQKKMHYIPQDLRLFNMSLRDNITYGTSNVSEQHLLQCIEQADLLDLIRALPMGLDSLVGEMGANLSGGEKQKVAIARALLIKPDILLLDETTHSLHADCENKVLNHLFSFIPTVLVVSHKASTLQFMNRLLKIHEGELKEVEIPGTLDVLAKEHNRRILGNDHLDIREQKNTEYA